MIQVTQTDSRQSKDLRSNLQVLMSENQSLKQIRLFIFGWVIDETNATGEDWYKVMFDTMQDGQGYYCISLQFSLLSNNILCSIYLFLSYQFNMKLSISIVKIYQINLWNMKRSSDEEKDVMQQYTKDFQQHLIQNVGSNGNIQVDRS